MKHPIINKILIEWAYRVHDGMPNPKNPVHLVHLRESLEHLKIDGDVINLMMNKLYEQKFYARNPKGKNISVFTDKDNYEKAVKSGYEPVDKDEAEKEMGQQGGEEPEQQDQEPEQPEQQTQKVTNIKINQFGDKDDEGEKNTKIIDDLVNGNLDELIKSNNELLAKRALG